MYTYHQSDETEFYVLRNKITKALYTGSLSRATPKLYRLRDARRTLNDMNKYPNSTMYELFEIVPVTLNLSE